MGSLIAAASATPVHALVVEAPSPSDAPSVVASTAASSKKSQRKIAQAATWHVDPALLQPQPTDSLRTAEARVQLGDLSASLTAQVAAYDAARAGALAARAASAEARADLGEAREELASAREKYDNARHALISAMTDRYSAMQLAPVALVLTSTDLTQLDDLTRLEEMARGQTAVVALAERAREELHTAELAMEDAERRAAAGLTAAADALVAADQARRAVLEEARLAQSALQDSALADVTARTAVAGGYRGAITFPLAPDAVFTDLDNFGGRGGRWRSTHTGDDFSTACGTAVLSATDGTVLIRTDQSWSGRWLVMVSTAEGSLTTWYAHMRALDVVDGEQVQAGEPLGEVGQEGNATGCHLHFEVHPVGGSIYEDDTDPVAWLEAVGAYWNGP